MRSLQQRLQVAEQRLQGGSRLDFSGGNLGGNLGGGLGGGLGGEMRGEMQGRSPLGLEAIGEGHESDLDTSLGWPVITPARGLPSYHPRP